VYVAVLVRFLYIESKKTIIGFKNDIPMETQETNDKMLSPHENVFIGKTILVVDDIRVNYLLIKAMLGRTGARVLWAEDGFAALDIISSETKINLVLMDYNMPKMNGLETTLQIKKLRADLAVVSQSTYTDSALFDRTNAPFDAYLSKPIIPKTLIEEISKFIR